MPDFIWDKNLQRYRWSDTKKFVSQAAIKHQLEIQIEASQDRIFDLGSQLEDKLITLSQWEKSVAEELKTIYLKSYMLAKGGIHTMAQSDYGMIGSELKQQYKFLRGFSQDTKAGISPEMFWHRLEQFTKSSLSAYHLGLDVGHKDAGYIWERRHRTKQESCAECLDYESMGWQPIGTLPPPTMDCSCFNNCGCYKEFLKQDEKPQEMFFKRHSLSWGLW